jgi:sugar phosphate isomerase/epimerase
MELNRVGICTLGLQMLALPAALDEIARLGVSGVDLWQVSPYYEGRGHLASGASPEECEEVKAMAADRSLRIVHLASYPGLMFHSEVEMERINDLAWAKETADLCAACGIPAMRVAAGRGETLDRLDVVAPLLRQAAEYAARYGVRLCLETHHGLPTCRADWVRAILDAVGAPNLGVLYDPANLAPDDGYKDVPRLVGDRIFHVHLKNLRLGLDGKRAAAWAGPASGAVDMAWVLDALRDCGYEGVFAIEHESFREHPSLDEARQGLGEWVRFLEGR